MKAKIRTIDLTEGTGGEYQSVRVVFGPHYFLELENKKDGQVEFRLGATHHGFKADASEVNGELEKIIARVRSNFPKNAID